MKNYLTKPLCENNGMQNICPKISYSEWPIKLRTCIGKQEI